MADDEYNESESSSPLCAPVDLAQAAASGLMGATIGLGSVIDEAAADALDALGAEDTAGGFHDAAKYGKEEATFWFDNVADELGEVKEDLFGD
jgi:hypothetical protein